MKKLCKLLIIVVIFSAFALNVNAEGAADEALSEFEELLPPELSGITAEPDRLLDAISVRALAEEVLLLAFGERGRIISFLMLLLGCAVLIAVSGYASGKLSEPCRLAVGALCSLLIFERVGDVFLSIDDSLTRVTELFSALIPIFTGITLSGGGVATASAQAAGMNITLAVVGRAGTAVMLSAVGLGLALALLSAFGDENIALLSKSLSGFFKWAVGIATTAIAATLSLQSVVATAADSAAMRAAKYAASGLIPVVGSAVSGALSTLASGLSYAKGIVGAGAIAVMLSIVLSPLIILLLYRLAFSFAVSFSDFLGASAATGIFGAYRTALDTLIAVYSLCSVICIFEIILFMKGGVALL